MSNLTHLTQLPTVSLRHVDPKAITRQRGVYVAKVRRTDGTRLTVYVGSADGQSGMRKRIGMEHMTAAGEYGGLSGAIALVVQSDPRLFDIALGEFYRLRDAEDVNLRAMTLVNVCASMIDVEVDMYVTDDPSVDVKQIERDLIAAHAPIWNKSGRGSEYDHGSTTRVGLALRGVDLDKIALAPYLYGF